MKIRLHPKLFLVFFITLGIFLLFVATIIRMGLQHQSYQEMALNNILYEENEYANRGIIYDRNKEIIIGNLLSYHLTVVPHKITRLTDTALLCQLLKIDKKEWQERLDKSIKKNGRNRESIFYAHLPHRQQLQIQENIWKFDGFHLKKHSLRMYNQPVGFHALGYVGRVSNQDIRTQSKNYSSDDFIGKTGIEKYYDSFLRGKNGKKYWIRNNKNKIIQPYDNNNQDTKATQGQSLITGIDVQLQALAEKLLQNKAGAIVAIEPSSGEILCMASAPLVNPYFVREDVRTSYYKDLSKNANAPLLNRAIQGRYSPGSVFKIIEAVVGLERKVIDTSYGYDCRGYYSKCVKIIKCEHNDKGHAANLKLAIINSCNSYFVNLFKLLLNDSTAEQSGTPPINMFKKELSKMGIGKKLNIDIRGEVSGFMPDSSYYTNFYGNTDWNFCTIMSLGIGQGELLVTPLQLANFMCTIANAGWYRAPHITRAVWDEKTDELKNIEYPLHQVANVSENTFHIIQQAMYGVVEQGTAQRAILNDIAVAGKTGTVENYTIKNGKRIKKKNNAVFVGFAPVEDPKIALAVIVENAGYASEWAVPIASLMIENYIKRTIPPKRKKEAEYISKQVFLDTIH